MTWKICVALLMVASLATTPAQGDEINPQIANCQEITDPDTQFQVELCTAHVGCKLVMGIHSGCTKVKTFLNKLKNLSFSKKTIDSSDVFDASAPSTEGDESFNRISNSIKASYDKQQQKQILSGEFQTGGKWVYEGPMTNGERNGTGVLITERGTAFRGDFVNGRQAGMGESFNGEIHKAGSMVDDKMDGFGVLHRADGGRFEGSFKNDRPNGQGTGKWPDGKTYTGNWVDGKKHGQGTFKWPDGVEYTGNYVNNKKHGQGTYKRPEGDEYTGNWVDNKQQGQGTHTLADGTRFEGEWQGDTLITGTQISANGTRVSANGTRLAIFDGKVAISPQQSAAAQATPPMAKASSGSGSGASSGRVCDTQCGMIVAESKCKHVKDNRDNLSCSMKNGMMLPDTPQLCAEAKALSGCVTQAEKEAAKKQEIPHTPSTYKGVLNTKHYAKESVCALAWEEWGERNKGRVTELNKKYKGSLNGTVSKATAKEYEIWLKFFQSCAEDDAEFKRRAGTMIKGLEERKGDWGVNCGGQLGNGGPRDDKFKNPGTNRYLFNDEYMKNHGCITFEPELNEYFAKLEQNAVAAVEWAKSVKVDNTAESAPSQSIEEQACAVSLQSLEKQFNAAQREIPHDSVVVRSESVLWVAAESIAKIKAQCPQSATYQRQSAQLQTTSRETQRVCDAHASSPPCVPRLPGNKPAPAPQAAAPLPPLKNKPPEDCRGKGANFKKCFAEACAKRGHTVTELVDGGDTCYVCDRGGSDQYTSCVSGFGSAR